MLAEVGETVVSQNRTDFKCIKHNRHTRIYETINCTSRPAVRTEKAGLKKKANKKNLFSWANRSENVQTVFVKSASLQRSAARLTKKNAGE